MRLIIACLTALCAAVSAQAEETTAQASPQTCLEQIPCKLGDRSYHVKLPDAWDGQSPMAVMLHFHGWQRQGTLIVKHGRISGATRLRNVLLLAPNGRNKTWNFWNSGTEDVDFARAVLEDAAKRYPIDRDNIFVSGYSFGSAMAWRFACDDGADVRALLAVSGTLNQNETCDAAPQEIRHVHGLTDNVMDFPFGPGGDTLYPVQLWRDKLGCTESTETAQYGTTERDQFERTIWGECSDGHSVTLDLHPRGHFIPRGWFAHQLDELLPTDSGT